MTVDRALRDLAQDLGADQPWPRPICPVCQESRVRFEEPECVESHDSSVMHHDVDWEPEWIHGTFTVRGKCENAGCRQVMHATGTYWLAPSRVSSPGSFTEFCMVKYLNPPVPITSLPENAPDGLQDGVLRASSVLFTDPGLAATALRGTVERFLTAEGFSGSTPNGGFNKLDHRITNWCDAEPTHRRPIADLLRAVKWLGNTGTHEEADLTLVEVLEGAQILDDAFHRHYTGPDIDLRAKTINKAKGPVR